MRAKMRNSGQRKQTDHHVFKQLFFRQQVIWKIELRARRSVQIFYRQKLNTLYRYHCRAANTAEPFHLAITSEGGEAK